MTARLSAPRRVAIVGGGVAGAACAAGLLSAGFDVTVFDTSPGPIASSATPQAARQAADALPCPSEIDHGGSHFTATRARFRAVIDRAEKLGAVAHWRQRVYGAFPAPRFRDVIVPTPHLAAFCRTLLSGASLRPGHTVTGLKRGVDGWHLRLVDHGVEGADGVDDWRSRLEGPFEQVVLAIAPPRAAMLLTGLHDGWAAALAAVGMAPCWTLMAVTDELDWPWDAAEPERGPLAWVERHDRKPGRIDADDASGRNAAQWVAHATPAWSLDHLEDDPATVTQALLAALGRLLTSGPSLQWHQARVHRWRNAQFIHPASDGLDCWWSARLGLAVCDGSFGDGSVEAAWRSGDELADTLAASLDTAPVSGLDGTRASRVATRRPSAPAASGF